MVTLFADWQFVPFALANALLGFYIFKRCRSAADKPASSLPGVVFRARLSDHPVPVYVSDAIEDLTGYPASEFVTKKTRDYTNLVHPDDIDQNLDNLMRFAKQTQPYDMTYRIIRKDGSVRWVNERGRITYEDRSKEPYIDGIVFDITAEREKKRYKERFESITNTVPDMICYVNQNGICEIVNDAWCEGTGKGPTELIGKPIETGWPDSEFSETLRSNLDECLSGNNIVFESTVPCSAGICTCEIHMRPHFDRAEGAWHAVILVHDITKRSAAMTALKQTEDWTRSLLHAIAEGIIAVDRNGIITYANPAALEFLRYKEDEFIGQSVHDSIHYARADGTAYDRQDCPIYMSCKEGTAAHRVTGDVFWRRDGKPIEIEYSCTPTFRDGHHDGTVIAFRDVTEMSALYRNFTALLDNANDFIYFIDRQHRFTAASATVAKIAGYRNREELIGESVQDLFPTPVTSAYTLNNQKVMEEGVSLVDAEEPYYDESGHLRWASSSKKPLIGPSGHVTGLFGISRDVTEVKELNRRLQEASEAADAANLAKSQFLASMSHEIRTPMNAIIGLTQLALTTDLNMRQRDYLQKIRTSAHSLLGIVDDVLDFSKIEAGRLDIESVPFNLDDVLESIANLAAARTKDREQLEFLYKIPSDIPRNLVGDSLRLGQILSNLVSNAAKFTHSGEIVLTIEKTSESEDSVALRFTVKDTGIGMSKAETERLFEPFSQADQSTSRMYGGTGLGLSICKRLTGLMGGEIGVESKKGQGSAFHFTLPFGKPAEGQAAGKSAAQQFSKLKTLIVDDNEKAREIFAEMLRAYQCPVYEASSAEEGLRLLTEHNENGQPFNLVLMDWRLPGIDGIEAAQAIRQENHIGNIPIVILVTAFGRELVFQQTDETEIQAVLLKPITQSTLFDTITSILRSREGTPVTFDKAIADEAETRKQVGGARVLLVEDNAINQQVAAEMLARAGIHVVLAENGQDALHRIEKEEFDAVLMDVQMPVMNGLQATQAIRRKGHVQLPIIAITANAMAEDLRTCLNAGMNDYLSKPIDAGKLYATLLKWISKPGPDAHISLESVEPTPDATPSAEVLSLPGLSVAQGLRYLNGDEVTYRRMVSAFLKEYSHAAPVLEIALEEGMHDEALNLIHSLVSSAGYVGAEDLRRISMEIESALRKRSGSIPMAHRAMFTEALSIALDSANIYLEKEDPDSVDASSHVTQGAESHGQDDGVEIALRKLLGFVQQRKPVQSRAIVEQIINQQPAREYHEALERIQDYLRHYDFSNAKSELEALLND